MVELKMREGGPADDPDAERYGYWVVTGPQPENEVSGTIERARHFETGVVFFFWYLRRRTTRMKNESSTYMVDIAQGEAATIDEALAELTTAWQRDVGASVIDMPPVTGPGMDLPWSDL